MTLMEMLRVAIRGYKLIVIAMIAAVAVGVGSLLVLPATYQSTSKVYVHPVFENSATKAAAFQAQAYADSRTITYKELATTDLILEPVTRDLDLDISSRQLAGKVNALAALDTTVIEIVVTWDDPETAALIANRIGEQLVTELSDPENKRTISLELQLVQKAVPASEPSYPRPALILGLSALAGLLVGISIVLFMHSWRESRDAPTQTVP